MLNKEGITELKERLATIGDATTIFFDEAQKRQEQGQEYSDIWDDLLLLEPKRSPSPKCDTHLDW